MKNKKRLSVILPCYGNVAACIDAVHTIIDVFQDNVEVIVVLDGCPPEQVTMLMAERINLPHTEIILQNHLGKGAAVRTGVMHAKGEIISFVDSDGAIHPRYLLKFLDVLENNPSIDGVVGFRTIYHTHFKRKCMHILFHLSVKSLFGLRFRDTQTAMKMFRAPIAKRLFQHMRIQGYAFDIELLLNAEKNGLSIGELPVAQKFTESSMSLLSITMMVRDTLWLYRDFVWGSFSRELRKRRLSAFTLVVLKFIALYPFSQIVLAAASIALLLLRFFEGFVRGQVSRPFVCNQKCLCCHHA